MEIEQIEMKRRKIVEQFGEWTAHNIYLKENSYTYGPGVGDFLDQLANHGTQLRRIVQVASDITNRPFSSLRVLDLACLEGLYGLEFARHGANVVAVEGRSANIEKALFAKSVLALDNIVFVKDDVRNLSVEKYGRFDVVLCLGILYHLDAPDVFHFVERVSEVCERVTIICTHVARKGTKCHTFRGKEYFGSSHSEHPPESSTTERIEKTWNSLDNEESFWLTRPSLFNLFSNAGFSSVYTCQNPALPRPWPDPSIPPEPITFPGEDTLVAIKGDRQSLFSAPLLNEAPDIAWGETSSTSPNGEVPSDDRQK